MGDPRKRSRRKKPPPPPPPPVAPAALDTVRVPEPMREVFLRAQEYVRRYFAGRVENPQQARVEISGERYILVRAASMSVEFFDLVMGLYRDRGEEEARRVANGFLFDIAHALGKADAKAFHEKMGVSDPIERLSAGPIHFAHAGWAFVDILPESKPSPDEDYFLIYDHPFSFEAESWLKRGQRTEFPVCVMNAGYSSGWCEESFGVPLVAVEIECRVRGDERCRFIMAPPSRIGAHLARYGAGDAARADGAAAAVPEFFQRKRIEEVLHRARDDLETRVEERTRALRESEEKWRSLVQNIPDVVITVARNGTILAINRVIISKSIEEVIGRSIYGYLVPEDHEGVRACMERVFRTGEPGRFEAFGDGVQGPRTAWYETRVVPVEREGEVAALTFISRDITERRRAENALRESEEAFRLAFENAQDAIFWADPEAGVIVNCNRAAERLLEREKGEIVGCKSTTLHPPEKVDRYVEQFRRHAAQGGAVADEAEVITKSGRIVPVLISAATTRLGEKPVMQGIFRDVTDQKRAEKEIQARNAALARANRELERLHRAKDEFIAMVSHELRTPLVTGLGYTELLLDGRLGAVTGEAATAMGVALKNLKRLSTLIDGILEYHTLIDKDRSTDLARAVFDLAPLLHECVAALLVRTGKRPEDVTVAGADAPVLALADEETIRQVIGNLLDNAVRHAGEGARVRLSVEPAAGGRLRVAVGDDGVGMDEALRAKVFEPFVKADESTEGSGLGLAIVRRILEAHEAPLSFESAKGRGTTVSFTLPAGGPAAEAGDAPPSPLRRAEETPACGSSGVISRILVVEDDEDSAGFLKLTLAGRGYAVRTVRTAEEALAALDAERFGLALVDLSLPGMNGADLCRRLRAKRATAQMPLCILTARSEERARADAARAGCDCFLRKPIAVKDLLRAVRERLAASEK